MLVSVCIPCYNSAETLPTVVRGIQAAFEKHPAYDYQILLANDGSPDRTFDVIAQLCEEDRRIIGFDLSRNFGQGQALCALYRHIEGDMAVFMDDDGQHPAEGIFALLEKIEEGYDFAIAKFEHKKHTGFKVVTSAMHRLAAEWCGTCPPGITYSSFTAMSRVAIDAVKTYDTPYASVGAYLMNVTTRFVNVPMPHQARMAGHSGYTLKKMFQLALTSLTSFSLVPLRLAALLGALFTGVGLVLGIVLVVKAIVSTVSGASVLAFLMLLIGGILMLLLGLVGEYLGRLYMMANHKPTYIIRRIVRDGQSCACPPSAQAEPAFK